MRKRLMLATLLGLFVLCSVVDAQTPAAKPTWLYAHDLRVRKGGTTDFDKDTPKVGVEFFKDESTGAVLGITQNGFIAATSAPKLGTEKKAPWLFAQDLRARKADEDKFTGSTAKFGVETFKDHVAGKLLYVSEKGTITFADVPAKVGSDEEPKWHHALIMKTRGPKEKEFTKDTKRFGVEAFKDGNTGGLIYISETGAVAAAPAPDRTPTPDQVKAPKALYGLTLRARKFDETDFSDATKSYGVEVFRDENTGGLLYVSETGAIAAVPAPAAVKTGQGVTWKHAMVLKVRPGGEKEFAKANSFGVEVFVDNNSGYFVYVTETGSIAVPAQ